MRIDSAFPSNYLKASDLQGRTVKVKMNYVSMEDIGGDHKPVLYFIGKEKGMVLNKTNSNNISGAFGYETDSWAGQEVELFPTMVDFQGKSVEAIRIRVPSVHPYAPPPAQRNAPIGNGNGQAQANAVADHLSDEIPF